MRTEDEFGWEGMTERSCGGSLLGSFKLARMKAPRAGGTKMVRCVDGMGSLLRSLTWFLCDLRLPMALPGIRWPFLFHLYVLDVVPLHNDENHDWQ